MSSRNRFKIRIGLCATLLTSLVATAAWAQSTCPSNPGRFAATGGGDQILDRYTGLIWQRCSLGQSWNGSTCAGTASTYSHQQSLVAAGQAASGWRMPNIRELASLVDEGCYNASLAAVDVAAFPAMPGSNYYWSATPDSTASSRAWVVEFLEGNIASQFRSFTSGYVRLVRSTP